MQRKNAEDQENLYRGNNGDKMNIHLKNIKMFILAKIAIKLPEDKKRMLKYDTKTDRILSFILNTEFYRLVSEYPNSDRYYEMNKND